MRALGVALCVYLLAACGRMGFGDDVVADDVPETPRLTIVLSGTGGGTILGPDGIQCSATCTLDVRAGTTLTLRGAASTASWFAGWSGPCGGNFDCTIAIAPGATGETTVDAEFAPLPNRAFVTGALYAGLLGGLAGADAECATAAQAAGLEGDFIAYLSDSNTDAVARLAGSRGWIRTDGAPIADLATDFAGGLLVFPIRLDEYGNDLGSQAVSTGTDGGYRHAHTCTDWTTADPAFSARSGSTSWGSLFMVGASSSTCDSLQHLICVETGRNVPVASKRDTGRVAFMSSTAWTPGQGIASADALCASDAVDAGQAGSFLAALATTTASIADRFAPGTWRRSDDVRLVRDEKLFTADYLDVAPELDLGGAWIGEDFWTGATRWNGLSDPSQNCSDWTVNAAAADAEVGYSSTTDVTDAWKLMECDSALRLLCLEE